ncbi:MAG: hypothetical protein HC846_05645 [Blastocatellia bacterium]|nr:hypothetical protein [Blastocatellia bacterium]
MRQALEDAAAAALRAKYQEDDARAIEAELFIIAAAQAGHHEDGRDTYGHSLVADPWGELLLEMDGEPGLAFSTDEDTRGIDPDPVEQSLRPRRRRRRRWFGRPTPGPRVAADRETKVRHS